MAPAYDTLQYLLDRANIIDTVSRVPLYYDTHNVDGLERDVYAPEILIDYTSILGGEPFTIARSDWVAQVRDILRSFGSTQHITSDIVADLPQPGPGSTRPDKATVTAEVTGTMVAKQGPTGDKSAAPSLTQNGGVLTAELARDDELEKQGLNPWRITMYKVVKRWERGDDSIFDEAKETTGKNN